MERKMHAWRIEEREIKRQESRRGRRHAYVRLAPERTALIVVDMVPFFVAENEYTYGIVPNISMVADTLRASGGIVAWILPGATVPTAVDEEFFGAEHAKVFAQSGGDGPLRTRVWHEFDIHDEDLIMEKTATSAFFPCFSPLPELLRERSIDTVVITGTVTNVCSEASARDAATLGYRVIFVADGNSARRDEDHNSTLYTIYRTYGDVRTAMDVIRLINEPDAGVAEQVEGVKL